MLIGLADMELALRAWLFFGKLHPVAVHFPIALLIVGVALEFFRVRRGVLKPSAVARACVVLGAFAAILAAAMGWSDAISAGHPGPTVQLHRWLGVATATLASVAALFALVSSRRGTYRPFNAYRVSSVAAAGLVGITGHLGGTLVYGPAYVGDALALLGPHEIPASAITVASSRSPGSVIQPGAEVDFVRDVRPIFARRCFSCHSGDESASELDLDDRANVLRGGESGEPALVAGDAVNSRLIRVVTGREEGLTMPPKGGPLDADQVATLTRWIDQGAKWADGVDAGRHWHWAYRPPVRPTLPAVRDTYWPRSPIDYFLLAKLEQRSIAPSPDADRATLLRRLSLDLTGLPPTPHDLDVFEEDRGADAYERAVDRLLASPHYGERWAQVWLDLARYADSHGYEKDDRRVMWPYRDWTIEAFNRDLPFDEFTIDQLAGDLVPEPTLDQLVATGFHRNSMVNEEGGVDAEEFRVEAVIDRANTTASVWLGSTVGCSQCHDHKFDPFSQKDYYKFFAFLNQDEGDSTPIGGTENRAAGGMIPVPAREDRAEFERLLAEASAAEAELARLSVEQTPEQQAWERTALVPDRTWTGLVPSVATASEGAGLMLQTDGSLVASGTSPERSTYTIEFAIPGTTTLHAMKLAVFPDASTPSKGVGRAGNGNFVLHELSAELVSAGASVAGIRFVEAGADFEQGTGAANGDAWPVSAAIDGVDSGRGWAIGGQTDREHSAVFRLETPVNIPAGQTLRLKLVQHYGGQHTLGRFAFSTFVGAGPVAFPLPDAITNALHAEPDRRTNEQLRQLTEYYNGLSPRGRLQRDLAASLRREINAKTVAKAMVMRALPGGRETRVFQRGSFLNPGEAVVAAVPAVFSSVAGEALSPDRLGLARWLVDPRNPLTARVQVNRLWSRLFGKGLVETEDDFGTQGEPPTHPELLDWLATEFIRNGWSQKSLLRTIVTSAAYRQSSHTSPTLLEQDPMNRLLSRAPRYRVDAETVRDVALAASGLLAPRIGGPSVFPPQPPGVWTMIYNNDQWVESDGENRYRRGLYTFARRTAPYPMFTGFDAPSREIACTRRARTNTPLQALSTLNDTQFVEASRALAARMMNETDGRPGAAVSLGFRLCVGRAPTGSEADRLIRLFHEQVSAFMEDPAAASALTGTDGPRTIESAAWQVVANVLLNLDETLTKG